MTGSWDDTPPGDCDAPESHPDGCACVQPGEERPVWPWDRATLGGVECPPTDDRARVEERRDAEREEEIRLGFTPVRRAASGGRWRSPGGREMRAVRVENGAQLAYVGGSLAGVIACPTGDHLIVWDDGTKTPAREVADPRCGWKAILEVEER